MALNAQFQTGLSAIPAYFIVKSYQVDRSTNRISGIVNVYASAAARDAFKAADAALTSNHAAILEKLAQIESLTTAYRAKTDTEQAAGKAAFDAAVAALNAAVETLKEDNSAQFAVIEANKALDKNDVSFLTPPGAIAIGAGGEVTLADIYTWLAANQLSPATAA
jgi:hypothetical protein